MKKIIGITIVVILLTTIMMGCKSGTQGDSTDTQVDTEVTQAVSADTKANTKDAGANSTDTQTDTEDAGANSADMQTDTEDASANSTDAQNDSEDVGTSSNISEETGLNTNTSMRDITTMQLVYDMGMGINLGNTLDSTGDWINSGSISNYETAWGSPIITEDMVKAYADAGFRTMRIPVTWSNMMLPDYTIHPELMNRVQQIVDWVIDNGMYAIVDLHHDSFIGELFPTNEAEGFKKYEAIWSQVSERFKDYNDYLMFESMNEPGFDKIWNQYSGTQKQKEKAFDLINRINQRFVNLVRGSGGNNAERHLLISAYYTNIGHATNGLTKMPDDPAGRCAISVHYYTPWTFVGLEKDESWGKARWDWGTPEDYDELNSELDLMKVNYVDKGVPVIIGEYGCGALKERQYTDLWTLEVVRGIYERGMCPILWDVQQTDTEIREGRGFFNRRTLTWLKPEVLAGMQEISATRRGE